MIYYFYTCKGTPMTRVLPDDAILSGWSVMQKQEWLSNEIEGFLQTYVVQFTTDKLEALATSVSDLDELERNGYPCRECGQKFKYHSTRVKYVIYFLFKMYM